MEQPSKPGRVARDDFTDDELRHRRARNDLRLKTAFECIFEKYGKDFTGIGDEIDLVTGKIVVNRGHLSSLNDEKDPGREEDLFDELGGEIGSDDIRATTEQSHISPENLTPAIENSLCSGLGVEIRDSSQSTHSTESLMGNAETGTFAADTDELSRLHGNKALSNPRARSPNHYTQVVQNENSIEPKWRAPPLPGKVSTCPENLQSHNYLLPDACGNRSMSPPGKSLWAPSKRGKKPQLARRTDTFTPLSKLSGLPLSPIKKTHIRRSMTSLSYEWSEIPIDQTLKQASIDLSALTSSRVCKSVSILPWTEYEDHKLYYLKSEAGVTDSQLAAAFPDRSKTDIEERWLNLHLDDKGSLVRGTRFQKDRLVNSINTSDIADRGTALSSTHCRHLDDQNSPPSIEIQPLRLSDPAERQISPVKPRANEQILAADSKGHHGISQVAEAGRTIDMAIDLKISDGEEAIKTADSGHPIHSPERISKKDEKAVNHTPGILKRVTRQSGILKRVTRQSSIFDKAMERPFIEGKAAVAGHETDAHSSTEIPKAQNQASPDSVSQLMPSSKKRPSSSGIITRAKRREQLTLDHGAPKIHDQKPSTPIDFVIPLFEVSTVASPSSIVATRSSRSSQISEVNDINPHSYSRQNEETSKRCLETESSINDSSVVEVECMDSDRTYRPGTISSDDGKSTPDASCMECSSRIVIDREGILGDNLLCSICFSRNSHRPCSRERSPSRSETTCRREIPNKGNSHTRLGHREDSQEMDCLLDDQPLRIITPAGVRLQKVSSTLSSTPTRAKTKSIPLRIRVIDDLSEDELSMPVPNIPKSSLPKVISPHANTSQTKSGPV